MRVCSNKMQLLIGFRKSVKERNFTSRITSPEWSQRQVQTDNLGVWWRKGAKQKERASIVCSDLQTGLGSAPFQYSCELYDFRPHLRHKHRAVDTVIYSFFQSVRSTAKS